MFKSIVFSLLCFSATHFAFGQSDKPISSHTSSRYMKTSDGVDLYVEVKGKGTPCLYVHGGPGSGSYWLGKFAGDMLEQHFQMIYLDQRGVCRSTSPIDGNYSMERMVKDFEEVRTALGIEQWLTLGHSFGGILQMGYGQRYPQAIHGMIMVNCTLNINESFRSSWCPKACELLNITDTKPYTDEAIPVRDRWDNLVGKLKEKELMWKMGYASPESEKIMNATFGEVPNWNGDFGPIALTMEEYWGDYRKAAPDMKMPVLFFYGRTDWMVGPEHYKGVHFPEMLLWESDVGHVPFIENRADLEKATTSYQKKYSF